LTPPQQYYSAKNFAANKSVRNLKAVFSEPRIDLKSQQLQQKQSKEKLCAVFFISKLNFLSAIVMFNAKVGQKKSKSRRLLLSAPLYDNLNKFINARQSEK
jgi:hypothetical protein